MTTLTQTLPARRARTWRRVAGRVLTRGLLVIFLLCTVLLLPSDGYLGADARMQIIANQTIGADGFRLGAWEAQALTQKVRDAFDRPGESLPVAQQRDLVLTYFNSVQQMRELSGEITRAYADPKNGEPGTVAAPSQARLEALRQEQERRRPAVERILQGQIRDVAGSERLLTLGRVFPPVLFQFTESPDVLIISPRERIEVVDSVFVDPAVAVKRKEVIEHGVESQLGVSALVEDTGGFAAYPTMVIAEPDLRWVLSTVAHEWIHTYLTLRPLGFNYDLNRETRTLNETVASIAGDEMGDVALERFYGESAEQVRMPGQVGHASGIAEQQPFDYYATMRTTRLHTDELLAQGRVEEAEAYMEAQRQLLLEHGYHIRRLNQAFFAFHGSYAVGPAATDPIGDKLRLLREQSASLIDFMDAISQITSVAELDTLLVETGK